MMRSLPILLLLVLFTSCSTPGAATPISQGQVAQTARDQSSAAAAETGSATNTVTPHIINAFGVSSLTVTRTPDGGETIEMEGAENATLSVEGGLNAGVRFGDEGMEASTSSGGATGTGTGTATRTIPNAAENP